MPLYTDKLLSAENKKKIFEPHILITGYAYYGYGWNIGKMPIGDIGNRLKYVSYSGGINGFNTIIMRFTGPQHLVVLFNNTGPAPLSTISQGILNILHGERAELPKKSIAETMLTTIMEEDVAAAIAQYRDLKAKSSDEYDFSEVQLNRLGYQLLGIDRVQDAIEIFKLNVEAYPKAFNTYDSLGEAYMIDGRYELAVQNYKKSIELNPGNENGKKMLQKIEELRDRGDK